MLKARTLTGTFGHYLKRWVFKMELLRTFWN